MEIKITTNTPPAICQFLDTYMLDPLLGMYMRVENKVIPLSKKKIRQQDIGKQREFNQLLEKFYEAYERKKIEKEKYDEKIKNSKKRPSLPNTGETARFRRIQS